MDSLKVWYETAEDQQKWKERKETCTVKDSIEPAAVAEKYLCLPITKQKYITKSLFQPRYR